MKLYRLRSLTSEKDLCRLECTIKTKAFWHSNFLELNDPMEGAFACNEDIVEYKEQLKEIFSQKMLYKICSFMGEEGFKNPTLWGYYAGGLKGVAIEIEVKIDGAVSISTTDEKPRFGEIHSINYEDGFTPLDKNIEIKLLTHKLEIWKQENEYRSLIENDEGGYPIKNAKITAIYFGFPYHGFGNLSGIEEQSKSLREYNERKKQLKDIAAYLKIPCYDVKISQNLIKIIKGERHEH